MQPERTGHVPLCSFFPESLYVCEQGNHATVRALAKLAGTTLADLERRRLGYCEPDAGCPEQVDQAHGARRRCWQCPFWARHTDDNLGTPIQFAYEDVKPGMETARPQ